MASPLAAFHYLLRARDLPRVAASYSIPTTSHIAFPVAKLQFTVGQDSDPG